MAKYKLNNSTASAVVVVPVVVVVGAVAALLLLEAMALSKEGKEDTCLNQSEN